VCDWEGSDSGGEEKFGWYCNGSEDVCAGPCNDIKSSQTWFPAGFWTGAEEPGTASGWEMDLMGCAAVGPEGKTPVATLNDWLPPVVTFLAGTGGGAGEGLRLIGAGPVVGVDTDRAATALEDERAGGLNCEGLQFMYHLNSYLAGTKCQPYEGRFRQDSNLG